MDAMVAARAGIFPRAIRWSTVRVTFGNIDGDNPAAMRYTEARLHRRRAGFCLDGIDEKARSELKPDL